jgi:hypothetical protein
VSLVISVNTLLLVSFILKKETISNPYNNKKKGIHSKFDHQIYVWDKQTGNLSTILHGPKEGIVDLTVSHDRTKS